MEVKLTRVAALLVLTVGLYTAPVAAEAQQAGKVYRIGNLWNVPPTAPDVSRILEAFRQGLRELGYVEGQNIEIEWRFAEGRFERFPDLVAELVRLKVDVIVTVTNSGAQAAKQATSTIPIVVAAGGDLVAAGLAASLARPGGNITGLTLTAGPEIAGKQLELLKLAVPKVSRVAVLRNPATLGHALMVRETEVAARALGLQLQVLEAGGPDEFGRAFLAMTRERAGALLVLQDGMFFFHRTRLADLAAKSHLPAMYAFREFVDAGGLMAYAANLADSFRRSATYVDKILKGAKPGDLPVEQPTKFELVINLKTAKALGLKIPQSVLIRADQVIQ